MAYFQNCDWSHFLLSDQESDLDQGLSALTDSLHGAIDHLAPEKTFQPKKSVQKIRIFTTVTTKLAISLKTKTFLRKCVSPDCSPLRMMPSMTSHRIRFFSAISFSSQEDPTESYNIISTAGPNGFYFQPVTANDVISAVAHFKSQTRGEEGIHLSIVTKELSVIAPHLEYFRHRGGERVL